MQRRSFFGLVAAPLFVSPTKAESYQPDHIEFDISYSDRSATATINGKSITSHLPYKKFAFPSSCVIEVYDLKDGLTNRWEAIDVDRDVLKITYADYLSSPTNTNKNQIPIKNINGYDFQLISISQDLC